MPEPYGARHAWPRTAKSVACRLIALAVAIPILPVLLANLVALGLLMVDGLRSRRRVCRLRRLTAIARRRLHACRVGLQRLRLSLHELRLSRLVLIVQIAGHAAYAPGKSSG